MIDYNQGQMMNVRTNLFSDPSGKENKKSIWSEDRHVKNLDVYSINRYLIESYHMKIVIKISNWS